MSGPIGKRCGNGRIVLGNDYYLEHVSAFRERTAEQIAQSIAEDYGSGSPSLRTVRRRIKTLVGRSVAMRIVENVPPQEPVRLYRKVMGNALEHPLKANRAGQ